MPLVIQGISFFRLGPWRTKLINTSYISKYKKAINPAWGAQGFDPFIPGGIASHHIDAGILGILVGLFYHFICFNIDYI
jgi:hypothetical protein